MNHRLISLPAILAVVGLNLAGTASATEVWSESFTGATDGSVPATDYTSNSASDWSIVESAPDSTARVSATEGNGSPSLRILDTSTTGQVVATVKMNQFADFDTTLPAYSTLKISFDWRVDSWLATTSTSVAGFTLRDGGGTRLRLGFGRASLADGDSNSDLGFFATPSPSGTMNASTTIGFTGSGWDEGFNFGDYNSSSGTANGTGGDFIHVDIVYVDQATTADVTLTRGLFSTTYTVTGITASSFSNTSTDVFEFSIPANGTTDSYFDNITVSAFAAIPEPSSVALIVAGASLIAAGALRRRRR